MTTRMLKQITQTIVSVALTATMSLAQTEVGSVASAVGSLEVQRAKSKTWQAIFVGAPVLLGDALRTGADAGARVVLRDDTVIDLGSTTQISVERLAADADQQRQRALVRLSQGQARVLLGARDGATRGRFEMETATAIAGGRTAAFVVRLDPKGHTDVIGLEGTTEVQGTLGVLESAAQVEPQHFTRVVKGRLPTPPEKLTQERFASYVSGMDIVGTGNRETLDVGHPALAGRLLRADDRPRVAPAPTVAAAAPAPDESYLHLGAPGESFAHVRSKDLSVVVQPIPELKVFPPRP
jgi:hypothetical protein